MRPLRTTLQFGNESGLISTVSPLPGQVAVFCPTNYPGKYAARGSGVPFSGKLFARVKSAEASDQVRRSGERAIALSDMWFWDTQVWAANALSRRLSLIGNFTTFDSLHNERHGRRLLCASGSAGDGYKVGSGWRAPCRTAWRAAYIACASRLPQYAAGEK